MKKVALSTLLFFIVILPLWAGEVYMWTDEQGIKHITETPPPKSNVKVDTMKYKRDEAVDANTSQEKQKIIKEETGNQAEKNASDPRPQQQRPPMQMQPERRPEEQQTQEINQEQELERRRVKEEDRRVEERN